MKHLYVVMTFIFFSQHKQYQNLLTIKVKFSQIYLIKLNEEILKLGFCPDGYQLKKHSVLSAMTKKG